ncbi:MAG: hypothetical protein JW797_06405 [Bradymonadales bacterium]|nr:hypothetical protein [Bradymonadales bacterium]
MRTLPFLFAAALALCAAVCSDDPAVQETDRAQDSTHADGDTPVSPSGYLLVGLPLAGGGLVTTDRWELRSAVLANTPPPASSTRFTLYPIGGARP